MDNKLAQSQFELDLLIKQLRFESHRNFGELVKNLKVARETKIWEELGYETWAAYLAQPDIDLQARTVDKYISIYNKIAENVEHVQQLNLDIGKLAIIAPHINKDNAEELLKKAQALSRSDLYAELGNELPQKEESQCSCNCQYCQKCEHKNHD